MLNFYCLSFVFHYLWTEDSQLNIYMVALINPIEKIYRISVGCIDHVTEIQCTVYYIDHVTEIQCTVYCIDHVTEIQCTVYYIDHVTEIQLY